METIIINKNTKESFVLNHNEILNKKTNSLYVRKTRNGILRLSQRGNGSGGAGDLFNLNAPNSPKKFEAGNNLYKRIRFLYSK